VPLKAIVQEDRW